VALVKIVVALGFCADEESKRAIPLMKRLTLVFAGFSNENV
jgi:hypothetical protein